MAAERLLRQGPGSHLVVLARASSGARLVGELQDALGGDVGARVTMVTADLSSLTDLRRALEEVNRAAPGRPAAGPARSRGQRRHPAQRRPHRRSGTGTRRRSQPTCWPTIC
ncbi:MAG: hypothetical protein M3Y91_15600 [Actinomycetota bacterium]|nr:hypothetical protein [Actinomycetota bacterium]